MVAALFAFTPGTAHADDPVAPDLKWQVSEYFATSFSLKTHDLADGATEDANGVVSFPEVSGTYDPTSGAAKVNYGGSVTGKQVSNGNTLFSVTLADPTIGVDGDGNGTVSALVSATAPGETLDPTRVVVTTFSTDDTDWQTDELGTLTATPDWDGVLPAGSDDAIALLGAEKGATQPVGGQAFALPFLQALPSSVRAFFYSSGTNPASDAQKQPATIEADAEPMKKVTSTVTAASPEDGLSLSISGSGFRGATNPGDNGVYVGLAPSGGLPDVSSQDGMAAFAGANWVPAAGIVDGAFTTVINDVSPDKFTRGTQYSLYTWQAHTHSNTTQDTETPVSIDFDALGVPKLASSVTIAKVATTYGKAATVTVTVPKATGNVTLSGAGAAQTKALANGKASFTLPATLAAGSHALTAAYAGDDTYLAGRTTAKASIAKAKGTLKTKLVGKAKTKKRGKLRVTVAGVAGATKPAGKVTLTLAKGKSHKTVKGKKLKNGKVVVKLPKLAKGKWKVKVKYAGNANYKAAKKNLTVKVRK